MLVRYVLCVGALCVDALCVGAFNAAVIRSVDSMHTHTPQYHTHTSILHTHTSIFIIGSFAQVINEEFTVKMLYLYWTVHSTNKIRGIEQIS